MAIQVNDKLVTVAGLKAGLDTKPNASNVYTKAETDAAIQQSTADAIYTSSSILQNVDVNTLKTTGVYRIYNGTPFPIGVDIACLLVMAYSPDWVSQILISMNPSGRRGHIFTRVYHSGSTWTNWGELTPTAAT